METKSLYSEVAIDLLLGQVHRSQPQTQTACYGRTSARAERNDHSALGATNAGGDKPCPRPIVSSSESCQKTEKNPQQNTCEKLCTDLAADCHLTGISKDLFRRQKRTNWGFLQAGTPALPEGESDAVYVKSVHRQFSKMQSRQDIRFFSHSEAVGESSFGKFLGCIQLRKLMSSKTTTRHGNAN